jgi:hypothetical protein
VVRMTKLRVLIAFEDAYRLYRQVIAGAIQAMRPRVEAATTGLSELETETRVFDPHLIISSLPCAVANLNGPLAWVQISPFPQQRTRIWIEERYREASNPSMEAILSVVDEVEKLVGDQDPRGSDRHTPNRRE